MTSVDDVRTARALYYQATLRYASATALIQRRTQAGAVPSPAEVQEEQEALLSLRAAKDRYFAVSSHSVP